MCKEPRGRPRGRDRKWSVRERAQAGGHRRRDPDAWARGVLRRACAEIRGSAGPGAGDVGAAARPPHHPHTPSPTSPPPPLPPSPGSGRGFPVSAPPAPARPPSPPVAGSAAAGSDEAEGGGEGQAAPRREARAAGQADRGEWGRAAGSRGWREGRQASRGGGWGPSHPWGGEEDRRGLRVAALTGGSAPLTFCARPSPWLPGLRRRCQAPRVPAAVTRAQVTPWLLSLDLLLPPFTGNLFSELTSPAPALPLSDSLKSDPLQGHCDKKEGRSSLTPEQAPVPLLPHAGQRAGFSDRARLVPVPLGCSSPYTLLSLSNSARCKNFLQQVP